MFDRFAARTRQAPRPHRHARSATTPRGSIAEGLARAPLLTPKGVKEGLEKVRMLPAVNGGPRTHMSLGPYDHKAYKGDWLLLRRIENGRTVFVDLHDPASIAPAGRLWAGRDAVPAIASSAPAAPACPSHGVDGRRRRRLAQRSRRPRRTAAHAGRHGGGLLGAARSDMEALAAASRALRGLLARRRHDDQPRRGRVPLRAGRRAASSPSSWRQRETDAPLLGAVTLETLGLMLNPLSREILPMRLILARLTGTSAPLSSPSP